MTYVYEYSTGDTEVKVEYVYSTVSEDIKVVDMWVDGKFHRTNWMSKEGKALLMARLEHDMTNRACNTDVPFFEGTLDELDHLVNIGAQ